MKHVVALMVGLTTDEAATTTIMAPSHAGHLNYVNPDT